MRAKRWRGARIEVWVKLEKRERAKGEEGRISLIKAV